MWAVGWASFAQLRQRQHDDMVRGTRVPMAAFALPSGTRACELRTRMDTSKLTGFFGCEGPLANLPRGRRAFRSTLAPNEWTHDQPLPVIRVRPSRPAAV